MRWQVQVLQCLYICFNFTSSENHAGLCKIVNKLGIMHHMIKDVVLAAWNEAHGYKNWVSNTARNQINLAIVNDVLLWFVFWVAMALYGHIHGWAWQVNALNLGIGFIGSSAYEHMYFVHENQTAHKHFFNRKKYILLPFTLLQIWRWKKQHGADWKPMRQEEEYNQNPMPFKVWWMKHVVETECDALINTLQSQIDVHNNMIEKVDKQFGNNMSDIVAQSRQNLLNIKHQLLSQQNEITMYKERYLNAIQSWEQQYLTLENTKNTLQCYVDNSKLQEATEIAEVIREACHHDFFMIQGQLGALAHDIYNDLEHYVPAHKIESMNPHKLLS